MVDFGRDWSATTDVNPRGAMSSGIALLVEALVRRITTPRGAIIDAPNYGIDATSYIDQIAAGSATANRIAQMMDAQFRQDQRVQRSATVASYNAATQILTTTTQITTAAGPFALVLSISNVTVSVLKAGATT